MSQMVRLHPEHFSFIQGVAALLVDPVELGGLASREGAFVTLKANERVELRTAETFGVDLRSRFDVDFVDAETHKHVGGASFDDPHPDVWWDLAHEQGRVAVIVGDVADVLTAATVGEAMAKLYASGARAVIAPLVVYAFEDGVGTTDAEDHA